MDQEMTHKLYVMSSLSEMNPYKTATNLVVTHFKFIKMYHNLQQQQKKLPVTTSAVMLFYIFVFYSEWTAGHTNCMPF